MASWQNIICQPDENAKTPLPRVISYRLGNDYIYIRTMYSHCRVIDLTATLFNSIDTFSAKTNRISDTHQPRPTISARRLTWHKYSLLLVACVWLLLVQKCSACTLEMSAHTERHTQETRRACYGLPHLPSYLICWFERAAAGSRFCTPSQMCLCATTSVGVHKSFM